MMSNWRKTCTGPISVVTSLDYGAPRCAKMACMTARACQKAGSGVGGRLGADSWQTGGRLAGVRSGHLAWHHSHAETRCRPVERSDRSHLRSERGSVESSATSRTRQALGGPGSGVQSQEPSVRVCQWRAEQAEQAEHQARKKADDKEEKQGPRSPPRWTALTGR